MSVINILGSRYEVYQYHTSKYFGEIKHTTSTIYINRNSSEDRQVESLIHEAMHGICALVGIPMSEPNVVRMATAVSQLLRANGVDLSPLKNLIDAAELQEPPEEEDDGKSDE